VLNFYFVVHLGLTAAFCFTAFQIFVALVAALALLTLEVDAQPSYKIIEFDTSFYIDGYTGRRRQLREQVDVETVSLTALTADDKDAVVVAFANSLQTAINKNGTFARSNVEFKTSSTSGSTLQVTLGSTVDFSNDAFAAGRNAETEYITNTVQKGVTKMISDDSFTTKLRAIGPTAFSAVTVRNSSATFSANTVTVVDYTFTIGSYDHDDPKRKGAKVGSVSVGVVVGVILLGLSFYIICFFRPPTTAKVEDGVVSK
jgi:hypothetical protein